MSPEQIEVERKAFEHKHRPIYGSLFSGRRDKWSGKFKYDSPAVDDMWAGWLARAEKAQQVREALESLMEVIDVAGLKNLSRGVQLGQRFWYVKASERIDAARAALKD